MARYPIYQIDFSAVSAGKHVASSKRRIKWRFGYPNDEALTSGQTGTACRGEEHDVVIVWSITSGKRQIMMDGREVHFTTNRTNVLEHSWSTRGNHVLKVVCHAAPPMTATPGFRQYDLFVDGQSFFHMPKVYELGLRGNTKGRSGGRSAAPSATRAPQSAAEEQQDLQNAIKASLAESKAHLEQKAGGPPAPAPVAAAPPAVPQTQEDMMSLGMADPTAAAAGYDNVSALSAPTAAYGAAPAAYGAAPAAYGAAPAAAYQQPPAYPTANAGDPAYPALPATPATAQDPAYPAPYAAPPAAAPAAPAANLFAQDYSAAPPTPGADLYDSYAAEDPFAPKPEAPKTHSEISNQILSGYGDTAPGAMSVADANNAGEKPALTNGEPTQAPAPAPMMQFEEEEPQNPFDAALKKLVNVENIDQPAEVHLTKKKEVDEHEEMKKKGKSKGLAPAAHQVVGAQATLSQISEVKGEKEPKKDIMKATPNAFSADAGAAGALVVYGDGEGGTRDGPPPLSQGSGQGGFGVVYQQQQQQQAYAAQQAYYQQQGYAPPPPQPGYGAPPAYAGAPPAYGAPPPQAGYAAAPPTY